MEKHSRDSSFDPHELSYLVVDTSYWQHVVSAKKSSHEESEAPSVGLSYVRALNKAGIKAAYYCANKPPDGLVKKSPSDRTTLSLLHWRYWQLISRLPSVGPKIYSRGPVGRELKKVIEATSADVLLACNINLFPPALVNRLQNKPTNWIGVHASSLPPKKWLTIYSHIFSALPPLVHRINALGLDSSYLPLAFEREVAQSSKKPLEKRNVDVGFVGTLNRHFFGSIPLFRSVAKVADLHIYSHSHPFKFLLTGLNKAFSGRQHGAIEVYSDAKLVINRHVKLAAGFSANLRMFEATASGALLVTEKSPNIGDLFEDGREVVTYADHIDASRKVSELLGNIEVAQEIARAGQKRFLKEHTFEIRARQLHRHVHAVIKKGG